MLPFGNRYNVTLLPPGKKYTMTALRIDFVSFNRRKNYEWRWLRQVEYQITIFIPSYLLPPRIAYGWWLTGLRGWKFFLMKSSQITLFKSIIFLLAVLILKCERTDERIGRVFYWCSKSLKLANQKRPVKLIKFVFKSIFSKKKHCISF